MTPMEEGEEEGEVVEAANLQGASPSHTHPGGVLATTKRHFLRMGGFDTATCTSMAAGVLGLVVQVVVGLPPSDLAVWRCGGGGALLPCGRNHQGSLGGHLGAAGGVAVQHERVPADVQGALGVGGGGAGVAGGVCAVPPRPAGWPPPPPPGRPCRQAAGAGGPPLPPLLMVPPHLPPSSCRYVERFPGLSIPGRASASGSLRNIWWSSRVASSPRSNLCLDSNLTMVGTAPVELFPCHQSGGHQYWALTPHGEVLLPLHHLQVRRGEVCLDHSGEGGPPVPFPCHGQGGNQGWRWWAGRMVHRRTHRSAGNNPRQQPQPIRSNPCQGV